MKSLITSWVLLFILVPLTMSADPNTAPDPFDEGVYTLDGDELESSETFIVDLTDPTGKVDVAYHKNNNNKANSFRNYNNILVPPTIETTIKGMLEANDNFEAEGSLKSWELRRWEGTPYDKYEDDSPPDLSADATENKPWISCDISASNYVTLVQGVGSDYTTTPSLDNAVHTLDYTLFTNTKDIVNEKCYIYQLNVEDESGRTLTTNETGLNDANNWTEAVYIDRTPPHVAINATTSLCKTSECIDDFDNTNITKIFPDTNNDNDNNPSTNPTTGLYDFQGTKKVEIDLNKIINEKNGQLKNPDDDTKILLDFNKEEAQYNKDYGLVMTAWTNHDIELSLNLGDNESGLADLNVEYVRNDGLPISVRDAIKSGVLPFSFCGKSSDGPVKGRYENGKIICQTNALEGKNPKHFAPNWKFNTRDLRNTTDTQAGYDEGVHKITLYGIDFAGNQTSATIILRIDKTAPKLTWSNNLENNVGGVGDKFLAGLGFDNTGASDKKQKWVFDYSDFANNNNSTTTNVNYVSQVKSNKIITKIYRCDGVATGAVNTAHKKAEDTSCTLTTELTEIIGNMITAKMINGVSTEYKATDLSSSWSKVEQSIPIDDWNEATKLATDTAKRYLQLYHSQYYNYKEAGIDKIVTGRYKIVFDVEDIAGNSTATINPAEPKNDSRGKTLSQIITIEPNQMTDYLTGGAVAKSVPDQTTLSLDAQCNQKVKRVYKSDGTLDYCVVGGTHKEYELFETVTDPITNKVTKTGKLKGDISGNICGVKSIKDGITYSDTTQTTQDKFSWTTSYKNNLEAKLHCMDGGITLSASQCKEKYANTNPNYTNIGDFDGDGNLDIYRWTDPKTDLNGELKCVIGGLLTTECIGVDATQAITANLGKYINYAWDESGTTKCRLHAEYQEGTMCGGLDFQADSVTACNGIIRLKDAYANPISNRPNISLDGSSQTSLDQVHNKDISSADGDSSDDALDKDNDALFFIDDLSNSVLDTNNNISNIRTAKTNFKTNKAGEVIFQMVSYAPTLPIMDSSQNIDFKIETKDHTAENVHTTIISGADKNQEEKDKEYMVTPVYYPDDWVDRPNKFYINADTPFELAQPYYINPNPSADHLIYPTTEFTLNNKQERQSKLGIYIAEDRVSEFIFQHFSIKDADNKGTHISNIEAGSQTLDSATKWDMNTPYYDTYKDRLTIKGGTIEETWNTTTLGSPDDDDIMMWLDHNEKDKHYEFNLHYERYGGLSILTTEPLINIKPFTQYRLGSSDKEKIVVYPLENLYFKNEPIFYQRVGEDGGLIQSTISQNVSQGDSAVNVIGAMPIEEFNSALKEKVKKSILDLADLETPTVTDDKKNILEYDISTEHVMEFDGGSLETTDDVSAFDGTALEQNKIKKINDNRTYVVKGSRNDLVIKGNDQGEIIIGNKPLVFITYGGNIIIKANIKYDSDAIVKPTIAFIAFRDEKEGTGGEIRVPNVDNKGNPLSNLVGTFIAERGVIAIHPTPTVADDNETNLTTLNRSEQMINQLIIKGTVMSFNTLGGGNLREFTKDDGTKAQAYMCPKFIQKKVCTSITAQKYDLNFLRRYVSSNSDSKEACYSGERNADQTCVKPAPTDRAVVIDFYFNELFKPKELY